MIIIQKPIDMKRICNALKYLCNNYCINTKVKLIFQQCVYYYFSPLRKKYYHIHRVTFSICNLFLIAYLLVFSEISYFHRRMKSNIKPSLLYELLFT